MGEAEQLEACFSTENSISEEGSPTNQASIASTITEANDENIQLHDTMSNPESSDMESLTSEITGKSDIAADDSKDVSLEKSDIAVGDNKAISLEKSDITADDNKAISLEKSDIEAEDNKVLSLEKSDIAADDSKEMSLEKSNIAADDNKAIPLEKSDIAADDNKDISLEKSYIEADDSKDVSLEKSDIAADGSKDISLEKSDIEAEDNKAISLEKSDIEAEDNKAISLEKSDIAADDSKDISPEKSDIAADDSKAISLEKSDIAADDSKDISPEKSDIAADDSKATSLEKSDIAADECKAISLEKSELAALPSVQHPKDLSREVQQSNADTTLDVSATNGFNTSAKIKATETRSLVSTYKLQFQTNIEDSQLKDSKVAKIFRKAVVNTGFIDTAAPFESVKEAVSKFGGTIDWKERNKNVLQELESAQEEIPKYKKQSETAEVVVAEVLKELESTKRHVDELKLSVEKAVTEEAQAKQDMELAELWAKEKQQGINNNFSLAAKAQLEVAKARHASTLSELALLRQELEALERDYLSIVKQRDIAIRKAEESESAAKEMEKKVEDLTIDLVNTKELIECAHTAHLEAEEKRVNALLSWDKEKLDWENELKQAEMEIENLHNQLSLTDYLKSKLDFAATLLTNLKAELAVYNEGEMNLENMEMERLVGQRETNVRAAILTTRKELEEIKTSIEKAKDEVNSLKTTESSLESEIQAEQTSIMALRQKEALTSATVSSLEAELARMNTELELIITREKELIEKAEELPKTIQQAGQEAENAKAVADSACEELKKVKQDVEQAKAGLIIMEIRFSATQKEIEAAKASEKSATSAVNAIEESEHISTICEETPTKMSISSEEYFKLSKRAQEAEEAASKKVISAVEEIKAAKESESKTLESLREANKVLEERRKTLSAALEKAGKAKELKLGMEEELRQWRAEGEQRRKASEASNFLPETPSDPKYYASEPETITNHHSAGTRHKFFMSRSNSKDSGSIPEPKPKKSFFPRIVMFLARKKVQTLK